METIIPTSDEEKKLDKLDIPSSEEIMSVLKPLWEKAVLDPKYDKCFDYTGTEEFEG